MIILGNSSKLNFVLHIFLFFVFKIFHCDLLCYKILSRCVYCFSYLDKKNSDRNLQISIRHPSELFKIILCNSDNRWATWLGHCARQSWRVCSCRRQCACVRVCACVWVWVSWVCLSAYAECRRLCVCEFLMCVCVYVWGEWAFALSYVCVLVKKDVNLQLSTSSTKNYFNPCQRKIVWPFLPPILRII